MITLEFENFEEYLVTNNVEVTEEENDYGELIPYIEGDFDLVIPAEKFKELLEELVGLEEVLINETEISGYINYKLDATDQSVPYAKALEFEVELEIDINIKQLELKGDFFMTKAGSITITTQELL